jgi:hypothetical protein
LSLWLPAVALDESLPEMRPLTPNIVVPFVLGRLRVETQTAVPNARFVDVGRGSHSYWHLMVELWSASSSFLLIEHDIVPTPGQIASLWGCPSEWCASPYWMDGIETTALGFVKFDQSLIERSPDLITSILDRHRDWLSLDSMVIGELHRRGASEHVHLPAVRHMHDYSPAEPRRCKLARLRYVGNGRYINGVPASDFETWDPETIAICLESGLYVEPEPAKRRGRPPMNKVDEPDIIFKKIPFSEPEALQSESKFVPFAEVELTPSEPIEKEF